MEQTSEWLGVKIVGGLKEVSSTWGGASLLVDLSRKVEMEIQTALYYLLKDRPSDLIRVKWRRALLGLSPG